MVMLEARRESLVKRKQLMPQVTRRGTMIATKMTTNPMVMKRTMKATARRATQATTGLTNPWKSTTAS